MAKEQQEILGRNWTKEVGSWKVKENIRNEFYQKAAGLKLEVSTDLDEAVKHPELQGLKTQEELNKEKEFKYRVKEGKNERLYNILDKYFKEMKIEPNNREKETALSLYCLTQQGVNVDLVVPSWKVEIKNGQLFITKSTGEPAVNGAYLRTIPGVTDKQENWKGWSDPAGLPKGFPGKAEEEQKPENQGRGQGPGGQPPGYPPDKSREGWSDPIPLPPIPGKPAPSAPKNNKSDILKRFKN